MLRREPFLFMITLFLQGAGRRKPIAIRLLYPQFMVDVLMNNSSLFIHFAISKIVQLPGDMYHTRETRIYFRVIEVTGNCLARPAHARYRNDKSLLDLAGKGKEAD